MVTGEDEVISFLRSVAVGGDLSNDFCYLLLANDKQLNDEALQQIKDKFALYADSLSR